MRDTWSEENILYLDCINVNILVVILPTVLQDGYHWRKLSKEYRRPFSFIFCNYMCIYNRFNIETLIENNNDLVSQTKRAKVFQTKVTTQKFWR